MILLFSHFKTGLQVCLWKEGVSNIICDCAMFTRNIYEILQYVDVFYPKESVPFPDYQETFVLRFYIHLWKL